MIKVVGATYLEGMPIMDYDIYINGIKISLKKEDFEELIEELGGSLKADYQKAVEIKEKYDHNVDTLRKLKDSLIKIFYEGDDESFFFKRELDEIDRNELWNLLEDNERFLNFK